MINQHQTIKDNIAKYNKPLPLADFLIPFIKNKISILDVGSGPYSIIGSYLKGVDLNIVHIDTQDFKDFWKKYNTKPFIGIEKGDMEDMAFPHNLFDLVVCINALDHTQYVNLAVEEMIKVCKPGGWVYIDCHLDQKDTGHKHKWNADKDGVFTNDRDMVDLKYFGFKIEFIDNGGESRYNKIIATLQKP